MRPRLYSILVVAAIISVVVLAAIQAWFVFVTIPQDIRNAQPVIIDQALLISDGPYDGCFASLNAPVPLVIHQGDSFGFSWFVEAPSNLSPSCTIQSIDGVFGPVTVTWTDLPVTILPHQGSSVSVEFAPLNHPYWGGVTLKVIETNP